MNTSQEHIPIESISDDIVFLKDGSGALVLQVSAVNFGLLSEKEQIGIIESFAQMLNSLSFSIQIVIYSKRLNITSYLLLLDKAQKSQTNPLLSGMMTQYRQFIQTLIKENDVLDKKFFCIIPLFKLELGLGSSKERLDQKIKTILLPRKDQVIRQLSRGGLKATQLTTEKLIELFFDIYNEASSDTIQSPVGGAQVQPTKLNPPEPISAPLKETVPVSPPAEQPTQQTVAKIPMTQPNQAKTHPFVIEELEDGI